MQLKKTRLLLAGVLAGIVLVVAAGCGDSGSDSEGSASGDSSEPFVIGFALSKTGFNAAVSQEFLVGLEIWQDMINNSTGIYEGRSEKGLLGRQVEFKYSDDQSEPEHALTIYQKLMTQDQVDLILPPYGSGSTGVVAPIAARDGYAILGASAASDTIYSQNLPNMVMLSPSITKWLGGVPEVVQQQGYKNAAIVVLDNPATIDSAKSLEAGLKDAGVSITSRNTFQIGNKDFTSIWTKVNGEKPDVIALLAFGTDAVTAMRQAAELNLSPKMWATMSGHWRNDVFVDGVGEDTAECVIGEVLWSPDLQSEGNEEFTKAYEEKLGDWGTGPEGSDASAAWGFASGQAIVTALDELGEAGVDDQQKLVDFLKQGGVETILGTLEVDPATGINKAPSVPLMQFQGGKRVLIWPDDVAQGKPQLPCSKK